MLEQADGPPEGLTEDTDTGRYEIRFNGDRDRNPTTLIVDAVAYLEDEDPAGIDPLYQYVEPEAVDRLFATQAATGRRTGTFSFSYLEYVIIIDADGTIEISPP